MGNRNWPAHCCDEFDKSVGGNIGEGLSVDRHYREVDIVDCLEHILITDIKYCPFCGKEIAWE
jgi:hypothetical protein